jgi:hypothetical protein
MSSAGHAIPNQVGKLQFYLLFYLLLNFFLKKIHTRKTSMA